MTAGPARTCGSRIIYVFREECKNAPVSGSGTARSPPRMRHFPPSDRRRSQRKKKSFSINVFRSRQNVRRRRSNSARDIYAIRSRFAPLETNKNRSKKKKKTGRANLYAESTLFLESGRDSAKLYAVHDIILSSILIRSSPP